MFNTIFEFFSYFCYNKHIYKSLILSTYNEYMAAYKKMCEVYSAYEKCLYKAEDSVARETYIYHFNKQKATMHELVNLLKIYYKKYPDENIKKFRHLDTYDEYPHRLTQHLSELINIILNS